MHIIRILVILLPLITSEYVHSQSYYPTPNPAVQQQVQNYMWQTLENDKQRAWESQSRTHVYDNQLRRNPYEGNQTSHGPMYPGSMSGYRQSVHGDNAD